MKTNFLYFREKGKQVYTYSSGNQTFTINTDEYWDSDITNKIHVKVTVTSNDSANTNVGSNYTAISAAGQVTTINNDGLGYNSDVITINTISDTDDGYTLEAGDIVTIELRPATLKHEACFRADSLLAIAPSSATATRLFFQAAEGTENDDVVTFTHADDDGLAFRRISNYFASVLSGQAANKDGFIVVADRANGVVAPELLEAGITKMIVQVQD